MTRMMVPMMMRMIVRLRRVTGNKWGRIRRTEVEHECQAESKHPAQHCQANEPHSTRDTLTL